jgi:hypothetical protein
MIGTPHTPSALATVFIRIRLVVLSFAVGALTVFGGAEVVDNAARHTAAVAPAHGATIAVTSLLGVFADDAAGVPGWVISHASENTQAVALGADALPVRFGLPQPVFSDLPQPSLSGSPTGANTGGGAIAASMSLAVPPTNQRGARPATAPSGNPVWVAARPEVRPG